MMSASDGTPESFWDNAKSELYWKIEDSREWDSKADYEKFKKLTRKTLPDLASHFDGKAAGDIKLKRPYIAAFEPRSKASFEEARTRFFSNGSEFLETLDSFQDLVKFEDMTTTLLWGEITFCTRLLLEVHAAMNLKTSKFSTELVDFETRMQQKIQDLDNCSEVTLCTEDTEDGIDGDNTISGKKIAKVHIVQLLTRADKALIEGANEPEKYGISLGHLTGKILFKMMWEPNWTTKKIAHEHMTSFVDTVNNAYKSYIDDFGQRLRSFLRFVGCANTHDSIAANMAELRFFYSTTVGFFAKLQDTYIKKEIENNKLRHYISALEFRYLLEKLTPPCQPDTIYKDRIVGLRWMVFWKEALKEEYARHRVGGTDHALKAIIDSRNPGRVTLDPTRDPEINEEGQKGQVFRTGKDLYSTLSDEIHRFRASEFGVGGDDDGWTSLVADTLRALQPDKANINPETGDIDWDAERKRYCRPEDLHA